MVVMMFCSCDFVVCCVDDCSDINSCDDVYW